MSNYCVYKHTSPSKKSYIGLTNNYHRRCQEHKKITNECTAFSAAIKKYGWDNFKHEILIDNLSVEEANDWEGFYIFIENTIAPNGYNLRTGGDHIKFSPETIIKIGKSTKGKKRTEETRERIRKARTGKKASQKALENMKKAQTGKVISIEQRRKISELQLGRKLSESTKDKIRLKAIGRIPSKETKEKLSKAGIGRKLTEDEKRKISEKCRIRFEKALLEATPEKRRIMLRNKAHRDKSRAKKKEKALNEGN